MVNKEKTTAKEEIKKDKKQTDKTRKIPKPLTKKQEGLLPPSVHR